MKSSVIKRMAAIQGIILPQIAPACPYRLVKRVFDVAFSIGASATEFTYAKNANLALDAKPIPRTLCAIVKKEGL